MFQNEDRISKAIYLLFKMRSSLYEYIYIIILGLYPDRGKRQPV